MTPPLTPKKRNVKLGGGGDGGGMQTNTTTAHAYAGALAFEWVFPCFELFF